MTISRAHTAGILILAALAIASFATPAAAEPPPQVTVTATDVTLGLPDQVEAGLVAFRYENAGTGIHNVLFIRLNEGKTLEDFRAARGLEDLLGVATPAGGTTTVLPG